MLNWKKQGQSTYEALTPAGIYTIYHNTVTSLWEASVLLNDRTYNSLGTWSSMKFSIESCKKHFAESGSPPSRWMVCMVDKRIFSLPQPEFMKAPRFWIEIEAKTRAEAMKVSEANTPPSFQVNRVIAIAEPKQTQMKFA